MRGVTVLLRTIPVQIAASVADSISCLWWPHHCNVQDSQGFKKMYLSVMIAGERASRPITAAQPWSCLPCPVTAQWQELVRPLCRTRCTEGLASRVFSCPSMEGMVLLLQLGGQVVSLKGLRTTEWLVKRKLPHLGHSSCISIPSSREYSSPAHTVRPAWVALSFYKWATFSEVIFSVYSMSLVTFLFSNFLSFLSLLLLFSLPHVLFGIFHSGFSSIFFKFF